MDASAYVYRHFDSAGRLLYVGLANHPERRLVAHGSSSVWHSLVSKSTYERFPNRNAAAAAEIEAIKKEVPAWNSSHNPLKANRASYPVRIPKSSKVKITVLKPNEPCFPWKGMLISFRTNGPADHVEVRQPNDGRGEYFDYHAIVQWMQWFGYVFIDGYILSKDDSVRLDWIDALHTIGSDWHGEYVLRPLMGLEPYPVPRSQ